MLAWVHFFYIFKLLIIYNYIQCSAESGMTYSIHICNQACQCINVPLQMADIWEETTGRG